MSLRLESLTPFFSHLPQIHCSDTYAKILNNKWPSHNKIKEFEHWSLLQTPINMDRVCVRPRPKKNPKLCVRTRFAPLKKKETSVCIQGKTSLHKLSKNKLYWMYVWCLSLIHELLLTFSSAKRKMVQVWIPLMIYKLSENKKYGKRKPGHLAKENAFNSILKLIVITNFKHWSLQL